MIRKAKETDLQKVAEIYERIHDREEKGQMSIGWVRGIYPTIETARMALSMDDLFVEDVDGVIVSAGRINQEQVPEYADAAWECSADPTEVMVLHTLVVDPKEAGKGYGSSFVAFYETYAREHGCPYLRMDTNAKNEKARRMYQRLGYREADIVPCVFNGIDGVQLVCLEKILKS